MPANAKSLHHIKNQKTELNEEEKMLLEELGIVPKGDESGKGDGFNHYRGSSFVRV
jgi:hypothetical protein